MSATSFYPERTRYFFQSPSTGNCVFLDYSFLSGRAALLFWNADEPDEAPDAPKDPHDKGLAHALQAPYWDNQYELERELRARQIDWTADNR